MKALRHIGQINVPGYFVKSIFFLDFLPSECGFEYFFAFFKKPLDIRAILWYK